MKKLSTIWLTIIALFVVATPLSAQYYHTTYSTDIQFHTGFDIEHKVGERWGWNLGEEFYFGNSMSEFQKIYSRLIVNYYLSPKVRISPMVLHIANRATGSYTMIYDLNIGYTERYDRLSVTLRGGTRLQDVITPLPEDFLVVKTEPQFQLRAHIAVGYRALDWLEPFANIETFLMLNPATDKWNTVGYYLSRVRSNVGVKFHIDKKNTISLYWRYDQTQNKYLSYELQDAPHGIITNRNLVNFVGVFYHYRF